ncbi:hypothetical protein P3T36_006807 [Kitasatospora sp. MAP12-15]|uniref:hypothetical protein n=1 Tax=unclassified Kitasatospora TaxID=2633591 RepID=UPI0024733455|nr:hypothetical protein [Kitasatospora sp. MAP12-44]MDH6112167.1 hypothetical protein [Kitasatospora sp. MAP12-44]
MTQPTSTSAPTAAGVIPAQRRIARSATAPTGGAPLGWAGEARRAFAIVRGLRSMRTVPARPQASYGESDGQ